MGRRGEKKKREAGRQAGKQKKKKHAVQTARDRCKVEEMLEGERDTTSLLLLFLLLLLTGADQQPQTHTHSVRTLHTHTHSTDSPRLPLRLTIKDWGGVEAVEGWRRRRWGGWQPVSCSDIILRWRCYLQLCSFYSHMLPPLHSCHQTPLSFYQHRTTLSLFSPSFFSLSGK